MTIARGFLLAIIFASLIGCASQLEIRGTSVETGFLNDDVFRVTGYSGARGGSDPDARRADTLRHAEENAKSKLAPALARAFNFETGGFQDQGKIAAIVRTRLADVLPEGSATEIVYDEKGNTLVLWDVEADGLRQMVIAEIRKELLVGEGEGWVSKNAVRVIVSSVAPENIESANERRRVVEAAAYTDAIEKFAVMFLGAYVEAKAPATVDEERTIAVIRALLTDKEIPVDELLIQTRNRYQTVDAVFEASKPNLREYLIGRIDEALLAS